MTVYDLNRDQLVELKQHMITEENDRRGEGTSYGELADADNIISDEEVFAKYGGTVFFPDDFASSSDEEYEDEEYALDADISGTRENIVEQLRLIANDIENGHYGGLAGGYGASWGLDRI